MRRVTPRCSKGLLNGCNSINLDVVLVTFPSECLGEADQTHFCCAVVSLSEVPLKCMNTKHPHDSLDSRPTKQASGAGCIDNPTELLLAEDWPRCVGTRECALEVNILNLVPFLVGHVPETGHHIFRSREKPLVKESCPTLCPVEFQRC